MSSVSAAMREALSAFEFERLFIDELGWDGHQATLPVAIDDLALTVRAVAQKRGMVAWLCDSRGSAIPQRTVRRAISKEIAKTSHEHLVIFIDAKRTEQVWAWARRETGVPMGLVEHFWSAESGNRAFLERLARIAFSLSEEAALNLVDVAGRVRRAFDVERVTRRFYDRFRAEHKAFLDFVSGIEEVADREWYASLMLNRLMFVYFMQRKGFLNGEVDYLRNRLTQCQRDRGYGSFYSFYRYFLVRLFHEGLGDSSRDNELDALLGRIPYLNGGLFEKHVIEERWPDIAIPDDAFERIFEYFDAYQWQLDERPLRNENEINPDVLGYIFEKYVNQKQMGAYYTKEDITGYISKSTVLPVIFAMAKEDCNIAFSNDDGPVVWDYLRREPERYIGDALVHGVGLDLPENIAAGLRDVSARSAWNDSAPTTHGLATETWREVIARRARFTDVMHQLRAGEVKSLEACIALNLDIQQLAQDTIEQCEGPELLRAFWAALRRVSVLDPTCGSGAFLFAALNLLAPLYEACLTRMEAFIADYSRAHDGGGEGRYEDFAATLAEVKRHPNVSYFTLKSIVLNNLFGVDIMEEAVEICKLRLFLKLAAQVEPDSSHPNLGIEPLPDIDFNIRAGNTLVGFASIESVKDALREELDLDNAAARIATRAEAVERVAQTFRAGQVIGDGGVERSAKAQLRRELSELAQELDRMLAQRRGVNVSDEQAHSAWRRLHRPFHWFIEFNGVMRRGGFDVVIGNPPYLERREIDYTPDAFATRESNAVHAMCIERSLQLLHADGAISMIVPIALTSTQRMQMVQQLLEHGRSVWFANFAWRPATLFDAVNRALTIFVAVGSETARTFTTGYQKWTSANRFGLLERLAYVATSRTRPVFWIPKFADPIEARILAKLLEADTTVGRLIASTQNKIYYRSTGGLYWKVFTDFPPAFNVNGRPAPSSRQKSFSVSDPAHLQPLIGILSSNLFWYWYTLTSNLRDLNPTDIQSFPIVTGSLADAELRDASAAYLADIQRNSEMKVRQQQTSGRTETQQFNIQRSKPLIDDIDVILAQHYGLTAEELDHIVNFEIKFRVGDDQEAD